MSYKYFYHVRIDAEGVSTPSIIEQVRNEPLTARFYRDVLRWNLSDCCPWRKEYPAGLPEWVRCAVYRVCGDFDAVPLDDRIYEEDMRCVAVFMWDRNKDSGILRKYWSVMRPDDSVSACFPY